MSETPERLRRIASLLEEQNQISPPSKHRSPDKCSVRLVRMPILELQEEAHDPKLGFKEEFAIWRAGSATEGIEPPPLQSRKSVSVLAAL